MEMICRCVDSPSARRVGGAIEDNTIVVEHLVGKYNLKHTASLKWEAILVLPFLVGVWTLSCGAVMHCDEGL